MIAKLQVLLNFYETVCLSKMTQEANPVFIGYYQANLTKENLNKLSTHPGIL